MASVDQLRLRRGEWVQIRSALEILATLDKRGELDGLPFMSEMLPLVGRRFRVSRRAEAACASRDVTAIRRMRDSVHLENLRCGGGGHGSCQLSCSLFWKEAWLKRTDLPDNLNGSSDKSPATDSAFVLPVLQSWALADEPGCYRCQATQLWQATEPLPSWDVRQYFRAVKEGGASFRSAWSGVLGGLLRRILHVLRVGEKRKRLTRRTPQVNLNLQVGEIVQVRSAKEIAETLDQHDKNRGLWFDPQMAQHCRRKFRVAHRIERVIQEGTGRLVEVQSPAVVLESVNCNGCWHRFCSREAPLFWREIWLQRVGVPTEDVLPQNVNQEAPGSPDIVPTPVLAQD